MHYPIQRLVSNGSLSDICMTVLVCTKRIHTVIHMKDRNLIQTNDTIKFRKDILIMIHQIIPCIIDMADVKTNAQTLLFLHSIIDCFQFLETSSDFTAFSRHRFQGNADIIPVLIQYGVQSFDNLRCACLGSCIDMAARVQYQHFASHRSSTHNFFLQKLYCQLIRLRLHCICQIDNIRCMHHNLINSVRVRILPSGFYI